MNRWSQVIALGVLLGLIVATVNYFYQAQRYSQFSKVLSERYQITSEIKEYNKETGEWPRAIGELPPNEKFTGWSLEFLSEDDGHARFRVKKGKYEREINVTRQAAPSPAKDERRRRKTIS
jgi:hypothetical protein